MIETEAKYKLLIAKQAASLALVRAGYTRASSRRQHDFIYAARKSDILRQERGSLIARIRIEGNTTILTVKIRQADDLTSIEYETAIEDRRAMAQILKALGLHLLVEVTKTRVIWNRQDFSGRLDWVNGLGLYFELEKLTTKPNSSTQRILLLELTRIFGASGEVVDYGYDRLVLEKR